MLLPPPPAAPFDVNAPTDPPGNAVLFLDRLFKVDGRWALIFHRGDFLLHVGTHYVVVPPVELEQQVSWYFENAVWLWPGTQTRPPEKRKFPVTSAQLTDLMRAIRNKVVIAETVNVSTWIEPEDGDPNPADLIPMANGLLNTVTRELMPSTSRFLNTYALSFEYDPAAPAPGVHYAWMRSMFGEDGERWGLTQEMIGYLLTPDASRHKMFCLTGPPRSGKGTMARLIEQLVGPENYGATSLSELGQDHGLQEIARKPVVVLGDAFEIGKNGGRSMERLLGIIGQDKMTVNPKHQKPYSAKLPCRFILLANDLPELPDKSQALRARWLHLRFERSFAGHEDRQLDAKLAAELPGIFKWALDGLDRLRMRGEFVQPTVGQDDLDTLTRIVSPETVFVEECIEVGPVDDPDYREAKSLIFLAWGNWARENGVPDRKAGSKEQFGKALKRVSATAHVKPGKTRRDEHGRQENALLGLRLTDEARAKYGMSEIDFDKSQMGIPPEFTAGFRHGL
jgi:putative DNA primase/helicase